MVAGNQRNVGALPGLRGALVTACVVGIQRHRVPAAVAKPPHEPDQTPHVGRRLRNDDDIGLGQQRRAVDRRRVVLARRACRGGPDLFGDGLGDLADLRGLGLGQAYAAANAESAQESCRDVLLQIGDQHPRRTLHAPDPLVKAGGAPVVARRQIHAVIDGDALEPAHRELATRKRRRRVRIDHETFVDPHRSFVRREKLERLIQMSRGAGDGHTLPAAAVQTGGSACVLQGVPVAQEPVPEIPVFGPAPKPFVESAEAAQ